MYSDISGTTQYCLNLAIYFVRGLASLNCIISFLRIKQINTGAKWMCLSILKMIARSFDKVKLRPKLVAFARLITTIFAVKVVGWTVEDMSITSR